MEHASDTGRPGPPTMLGGFALGASRRELRASCEGAGFSWHREGARFRCDGTLADVGFPARSLIRFCGERACAITLRHRLTKPSATELRAVFGRALTRLAGPYGHPATRVERIPRGCESDLPACLASRRAQLSAGWAWPAGQRLSFGVVSRGGEVTLLVGAVTPQP